MSNSLEEQPLEEVQQLRRELEAANRNIAMLRHELGVAMRLRDNWRINHNLQVQRARGLTEGLARFRDALAQTLLFREFMDEWYDSDNQEVVKFRELRDQAFEQDPDPHRKLAMVSV